PLHLYRVCIVCFQAEGGIRDRNVTGVQTCALPISLILNILLFQKKYQTPLLVKILLLLVTLSLGAFTYFAFLMPENGLPAVLFRSEERRVGKERRKRGLGCHLQRKM